MPGRPAAVIDTVVIHHISLPPEHFSRRCDRAALHQPARSAPPTRTSSGCATCTSRRISCCAGAASCCSSSSCDDRAWHAGASRLLERERCNDFSIGIELEGSSTAAVHRARSIGGSNSCSRRCGSAIRCASSPATATSRRAARTIRVRSSTGSRLRAAAPARRHRAAVLTGIPRRTCIRPGRARNHAACASEILPDRRHGVWSKADARRHARLQPATRTALRCRG